MHKTFQIVDYHYCITQPYPRTTSVFHTLKDLITELTPLLAHPFDPAYVCNVFRFHVFYSCLMRFLGFAQLY